jgi:hypothetical protein
VTLLYTQGPKRQKISALPTPVSLLPEILPSILPEILPAAPVANDFQDDCNNDLGFLGPEQVLLSNPSTS